MLKFLIALVVAIPTGWHIFATAVYLGPDNLLATKCHEMVRAYMRPIFYQNWHLFSPNPGITSDVMQVRCKTGDSEWNNWVDPFKNLRDAHYRNRMTGRGKLLYVYRSMGSKLSDEYADLRRACMRKVQQAVKSKKLVIDDLTQEELAEQQCTFHDVVSKMQESPAYQVAKRFSLDLCEKASEDQKGDVHAQIRLARLYPKQYTKRHEEGRWGDKLNLQFSPETRRRTDA